MQTAREKGKARWSVLNVEKRDTWHVSAQASRSKVQTVRRERAKGQAKEKEVPMIGVSPVLTHVLATSFGRETADGGQTA